MFVEENEARTSVGVIGLTVAVWVGLSWMGNLRVALTELWRQSDGSKGFPGKNVASRATCTSRRENVP